MQLADKMRDIASDAQKLRESLMIVDPRNGGLDTAHEAGERLIRSKGNAYTQRVMEAGKLLSDVYHGRRDVYFLKEAMTTSDFPYLFGDLLHRQLLGNYTPYPVSYPGYFRIVETSDLRKLNMYTIDGGQGILTAVKERAPYPEIVFAEGHYSVQVAKYGRRYSISLEMLLNDDLNAFQQRPMLMATGARRSEEYLATTMIADSAGPHASFFTSGHANIVTANPVLSVQALQLAFKILAAQKDADGQPIIITAVQLVVPPALQITAENILHATQLRINSSAGTPPGGGTAEDFLYTANWMASKCTLSINPYIPIVTTTGTVGDTSWYLIANPNDLTQRPAFVFAFLRGYRNPQLFIKSPNAQSLGGGMIDPMQGSFEDDTIDYKLRHFFGAAQIDPKMAVASKGTGS